MYNILAEEGEKHPAYLLDSKGIYSADLTVEYPRLKRITWENGYIEFVASEAKRKDIRSLDDYKHSWGQPKMIMPVHCKKFEFTVREK